MSQSLKLNPQNTNGNFLVIVECAIEHNDKFLIIKRPKGVHAGDLFAFPWGKVECSDGQEGHNILVEAVKREVAEEVGLILLDPIQFVVSSYFIDSHNVPVLDVIFHCKLEKTLMQIQASPREVPEYHWLSYDEILLHHSSPIWLKQYLSAIYQSNSISH